MNDKHELVRNLRKVVENHKDDRYGVGSIRISDLAEDCADAIEELLGELEYIKSHMIEVTPLSSDEDRWLDMLPTDD